MTNTGSGIVLVGYVDTTAGVVMCRDCADGTQGATEAMDTVYSPDVNEDTPACFACGASLDETETLFRIVRVFAGGRYPSETVADGLTIAQVRAWTNDPETSSRTAKGAEAAERTRLCGEWMDTYEPQSR